MQKERGAFLGSFPEREEPSVDQKAKIEYFSQLALRVHSAFKLHKNEGNLWEKKNGEYAWRNISEHCLVEVARTNILGKMLGLSQATVMDLMYAAALHDFSKRKEKELDVPKEGITWQQYDEEISEWSKEKILEYGFSPAVAELSTSMGHDSLLKTESLLDTPPEKLNEESLAYLAMHYIDGYTRGSNWVLPAHGAENEVDARANKDRNNPTLKNLQKEGEKIFNGRNYADVMRVTGHQIEDLFSQVIKERQGIAIEPLRIPEYIDEEIKKEIQGAVQEEI